MTKPEPNFDLIRECMTCNASTAADARQEIIEGFMAIRDGREQPGDFFGYRDPPLPLSCCRRKPREAA